MYVIIYDKQVESLYNNDGSRLKIRDDLRIKTHPLLFSNKMKIEQKEDVFHDKFYVNI